MRDMKDLYWLAGVIEGEGSLAVRTIGGYQYPRVSVSMTDEDVVRHCHEVAGAGHVGGPYTVASRPTHKPHWRWTVAQQAQAAGLMMTLYPLMGERRQEQIRKSLAAWRSSGPA